MSQQNSQSPSWGAPVSASWGSPLINTRPAGRNSPNNQQTPVRQNRDNAAAAMNHNDNSFRGLNQHGNNSPGGGYFTPRHFQPRPRYQSSPLSHGGTPNPRFSHHNSSQEFTPSPRHYGNNSFGSQRSQRSFSQRDRNSMNNPGGSNNINDYIHPSMLEDPWKDLTPMPFLRQY